MIFSKQYSLFSMNVNTKVKNLCYFVYEKINNFVSNVHVIYKYTFNN